MNLQFARLESISVIIQWQIAGTNSLKIFYPVGNFGGYNGKFFWLQTLMVTGPRRSGRSLLSVMNDCPGHPHGAPNSHTPHLETLTSSLLRRSSHPFWLDTAFLLEQLEASCLQWSFFTYSWVCELILLAVGAFSLTVGAGAFMLTMGKCF